MNYKVNWSCSDGAFAVPDSAVDNIKLASGKSVKVLMYIMRNKTAATENAKEIAAALDKNMSAEDVEDALSFWEQIGVICTTESYPAKTETETAEKKPTVSQTKSVERAAKMYSPSEIAEKVNNSPDIAFLFSSAETILGKALTNTEQRTYIWLIEYYSIGADVLLMLIEFCKNIRKTNIAYIEKTAASWCEKGINTHELAEAEIKRLQLFFSYEGQLKSKLELNRALTPKEKEIADSWASNSVSIDLVELAYERTVAATGKAAFPYMKKIIDNWQSSGVFTPSDVEKYEKSRSAAVKPSEKEETHSYDLDKLLKYAKNNIPKLREGQ